WRTSQEMLQREREKLRVSEQASQSGHLGAVHELQSRLLTLQTTSDEKDQVIFRLKALCQRAETALDQTDERSVTIQAHCNEWVRKYDTLHKEYLLLQGKLNQASPNRATTGTDEVTQVFANLQLGSGADPQSLPVHEQWTPRTLPPLQSAFPGIFHNGSSMSQVEPPAFRDTRPHGTPAPQANSPIDENSPSDPQFQGTRENILSNYFRRETLGKANIMKETQHAQRALRKYKLVSPMVRLDVGP
ncbi:hypothetical protein AAF712_016131, partial [Marasmius tenuissimus]